MLQTNCLEYNLYKVGHVLNWVIGLSHRYLVFLTLRSMTEPVSHLLEFCFVCSFVFKILSKNTIFPYIDRSKATKILTYFVNYNLYQKLHWIWPSTITNTQQWPTKKHCSNSRNWQWNLHKLNHSIKGIKMFSLWAGANSITKHHSFSVAKGTIHPIHASLLTDHLLVTWLVHVVIHLFFLLVFFSSVCLCVYKFPAYKFWI